MEFKKIMVIVFISILTLTSGNVEKVLASQENFTTQVVYNLETASAQEELELLEQYENNQNQARSYNIVLEPVKTEYKWTGLRLAGNQPVNGTNFGASGGAFGYKDGNGNSPVSLSFGVSGGFANFSIGVGTKENAGVNGYYISAPANKFVKLYVNKQIKVTTYKRYKVYHINGYKEPYGYTHSQPSVSSLSFSVQ